MLLRGLGIHRIRVVYSGQDFDGRRLYHILAPGEASQSRFKTFRLRTHRCGYWPNGLYGARESFFDDSPQKNAILSPNVESYLRQLRRSQEHSPWHVPESLVSLLDFLHLPHPAPFSPVHEGGHPIAATLELAALRFLKELLSNTSWYGLFINPAKLVGFTQPVDLFNPTLAPKDVTRFRAHRTDGILPPRSGAPVWFAHDVLQHLSNAEVGSWFDNNPNLQNLFATVVAPFECKHRIPSFCPKLYSLRYWKDMVKITFEGDATGSYWQRTDAYRWTTSTTLITPKGECLHIGVIWQKGAHAIVVIRRQQLIPAACVTPFVPELMSVPKWVLPFSPLSARLTIPTLVEKLSDYSASLDNSNWRDFRTKIRQFQMTDAALYPASYKVAAANYVLASRVLDSSWALSPFTAASFFFSLLFAMPLLAPSWFISSFLYSLRGDLVPLDEPFAEEPPALVSSPADDRLSNSDNACSIPAVSTYYVPPDSTFVERFWIHFVSVVTLSVTKFVYGVPFAHLDTVYHVVFFCCEQLRFRLSISWNTPVLVLIGLALSYWWNFSVPMAWESLHHSFSFIQTHVCSFLLFLWKLYWGLPSLPHGRVRAGYNWAWRILAPYIWFSALFKNLLNPIPSIRSLPPWMRFACILLFLYSSSYKTAFSRHPWHRHRLHSIPDVENVLPASPLFDSGSAHNSPPAPPPLPLRPEVADLAGALFEHFITPPSSPPLPPLDPLPLRPIANVLVAAPAPFLPPVAPQPLPPVAPPVPLPLPRGGNYRLLPDAYPTAQLFETVLQLLPVPQNLPPFNNMCVWDALSRAFNCDPGVLWAIFDSAHPNVLVNGAVPYANLTTVLTFFKVSGDITRCEMINGVPSRQPNWEPEAFGAPVESWPVVHWSLVDNGGGTFHIIPQPPNVSIAAGQQPAPRDFSLIASVSRYVSISEMRHALNYPTRVFQRIYHSFTGNNVNPALGAALANSNTPGQLPVPPPGLPALMQLPSIPLTPEDVTLTLTPRLINEARTLARDYKKYPNTLEIVDSAAQNVANAIDALAEHARPRDFRFRLFHGMPGTGKTTAFANEILTLLANGVGIQDIAIVVPNDALKADLLRDLSTVVPRLVSNNFVVQGKIFVSGAKYIFFDDATLFYAGFIPLVLACFPAIAMCYVTFDAAQARKVFPMPNCGSRSNMTSGALLSSMSSTYATQIRRLSRSNCELFGVDSTLSRTEGEVYFVTQQPRGVPLLVASPRFAETKANGGQETYSFSDSQGRGWEGDVAVDCGGLSNSSTDFAMWTALTRAKGSIWLVMTPTVANRSSIQEQSFGASLIISAIFAVSAMYSTPVVNAGVDVDRIVARALQSHLANSLSPAACALLGLNPPQPVVAGFERHKDSIWSAVQEVQRSKWKMVTAKSFRPVRTSAAFSALTYRGPRFDSRGDFVADAVRHYLPLANDTTLKISKPDYVAPTFDPPAPFIDPVDQFDLRPVPPEHEAVTPNYIEPTQVRDPYGPTEAQHHKGSDQALMWKSQPTRFPARRDSLSLTKLGRNKLKQLKAGISKFVDLPEKQAFNELLFEDCLVHCLDSWAAGKSKAQILSSVESWPVDWDPTFIRIFQKGQWIKKLEARGLPVKNSQIIANVSISRTMVDAVWCDYLERSMRPHFRSNFLFMNRLNPSQLQRWYSRQPFQSTGVTANDYTGWDTGMDAVFAFFCAY